MGLIPGSERSPGGWHGNPLQYSCLENPMDRGVHRVAKSRTRLKRLSTHACMQHDFLHQAQNLRPLLYNRVLTTELPGKFLIHLLLNPFLLLTQPEMIKSISLRPLPFFLQLFPPLSVLLDSAPDPPNSPQHSSHTRGSPPWKISLVLGLSENQHTRGVTLYCCVGGTHNLGYIQNWVGFCGLEEKPSSQI